MSLKYSTEIGITPKTPLSKLARPSRGVRVGEYDRVQNLDGFIALGSRAEVHFSGPRSSTTLTAVLLTFLKCTSPCVADLIDERKTSSLRQRHLWDIRIRFITLALVSERGHMDHSNIKTQRSRGTPALSLVTKDVLPLCCFVFQFFVSRRTTIRVRRC